MNILTLGNPGAGKSTLLNTMMQKIVFKSGLPEAENIGQGLTFKLDKYEIDGVVYIDTPGLCDDSRRKEAAKAVTEALKQKGQYKVFVIITLDRGRLRPEDLSVITMMKNSTSELTRYYLILNQVTRKTKQKLRNEMDLHEML